MEACPYEIMNPAPGQNCKFSLPLRFVIVELFPASRVVKQDSPGTDVKTIDGHLAEG